MTLNRRRFLGLAAGAMTAGALHEALAAPLGLPPLLPAPNGVAHAAVPRDPAAHAVHRLTFGPRPGLVDTVRQTGVETWIEQQLQPETLDDSATDAILQDFESLGWTPADIFSREGVFEDNDLRRQMSTELQMGTFARALTSTRQLYEVMVHFWSDHFNIFALDGPTVFLKPTDDRDVIRPHALGRFRDLLGASAHSPAMLFYLDNFSSNREHPNENYARELLELHTLGVNGGYTEADVQAAARVLTGWSIGRPRGDGELARNERPGEFFFRRFAHDDHAQTVLGEPIPAGLGAAAGERLLDLLAVHPSTARFLATKLARRLVADDPPAALVDAVAAAYLSSDGDIKTMLRVIFASDDFWNAPPKLKRPYPYVVSLLRALDAQARRWDGRLLRGLFEYLQALGHLPFMQTTPDGYPDVAAAWADNLLMRWNAAAFTIYDEVPGFSVDLGGLIERFGVPVNAGAILDLFADLLLSRPLSADERSLLTGYIMAGGEPDLSTDAGRYRLAEGLILLAASPAFQYR